MDVVHPRCAGIDCSKKDAKVRVRIQGTGRKRASSTVTTWGATTSQILASPQSTAGSRTIGRRLPRVLRGVVLVADAPSLSREIVNTDRDRLEFTNPRPAAPPMVSATSPTQPPPVLHPVPMCRTFFWVGSPTTQTCSRSDGDGCSTGWASNEYGSTMRDIRARR